MKIKNWPLFLSAIEQIIRHPETWNQNTYASKTACGTSFCVAGWVAKLAGAEPMWSAELKDNHDIDIAYFEGQVKDIPRISSELIFGGDEILDDFGYHELYYPDNTLYDVLRFVTDWAAEDGIELPEEITEAFEQAKADFYALEDE